MSSAVDSVLVEKKRSYLRDLGLPTVFGAVVLLVSATLLLGVNISALQNNLQLIEHSQKILKQVANMEIGILGDELTVRGYALSGDPRFLDFQNRERLRSTSAAKELEQLTSADPARAALFAQIMRDFKLHQDNFRKLRGLGPDHADVVAKAIVDPAVRANMKSTRHGIANLRAAEVRDLGERQREMTRQISNAFYLGIGIIIAAFVLGGFGLVAAQLRISPRR